ncbi:SIR2 family protein [Rothia amarae]|uniref:SIR2 family protein n=1 Tax=Rothia amarae TaxID=169480 RepID=UPI0031DDE2BB
MDLEKELINLGIKEQVLQGLKKRKYHIFLGAGASADSVNNLDKNIPVISQFTKNLVKDFYLEDFYLKADLNGLFEECRLRNHKDESFFYDYLRDTFRCRNVAKWYEKFVQFRWKQIWTLNVDNVLHKAYNEHKEKSAFLTTNFYNWDQNSIPENSDDLSIVHLHGQISHPDKMIFTPTNYQSLVENKNTWHSIFEGIYEESPFIIIGTRLSNEFDIARTINKSKSLSNEHPTLYINRTIEDWQKPDFKRKNIHCIEMEAKDFFEQLYALAEKNNAIGLMESTKDIELKIKDKWQKLSSRDDK